MEELLKAFTKKSPNAATGSAFVMKPDEEGAFNEDTQSESDEVDPTSIKPSVASSSSITTKSPMDVLAVNDSKEEVPNTLQERASREHSPLLLS